MILDFDAMQASMDPESVEHVRTLIGDHGGSVTFSGKDLEVVYTALYLMEDDVSNGGTKEDFIKRQLDFYNGKLDVDADVLDFIASVYHHRMYGCESRRNLFRAGYCLYFALMLQRAFDRGEAVVTYPLGHVVWQDENGVCYDIEGVYDPGEHDVEELIPFFDIPEKFAAGFWHCKAHPVDEVYANNPDLLRSWVDEYLKGKNKDEFREMD